MVYVPGFSPSLEATERGGPAFVGALPSVRPTAPAIMTAPPVQPNTPAPSSSDMFPEGLTSEALGSMLSTAPGAAGRTISPEVGAYYGLTPTGLATRDGQQGVYLNDERGWRHSAGLGDSASGFIAADPSAQYRLTDERGRNSTVAEGTGLDGLMSVRNAASKLNMAGKAANWGVERLNPATGQWERIGENNPTTTMDQLGGALDIALPLAGGILLPGVGGILGGALGAGLGAAGGSALSSVAQGRSLKDTLLRAGLSGVTAGGLSAAGGAPFIGGGGSASGVGGTLGGSLAAAGPAAQAGANFAGLGGITVLGNAAAGAAGAGLGGAAGATLGSAAGALSGFGGGSTPAQQPTQGNEIVVRPTPESPSGINLGPIAPALPNLIPSSVPAPDLTPAPPGEGHITVEGERPGQFDFPSELAALPAIGAIPTIAGGTVGGPQLPAQPTDSKLSLDDIIKYLRAGSLGVGVLGSLFEGGGRGNNRIPGGFGTGQLNPVFGGGLPAPTIPGASGNFAQRPGNQDWYRYGYGPGQSFFNYVPQGQRNTSTAYTGYAEGGLTMGDDVQRDARLVEGPGTGREDKIPSLLSDGEYVIDAETVALLGDGSTKAGADRLDQFRVSVRKHKGQQLAKGQFSPDAKPLEHYLKGGRA